MSLKPTLPATPPRVLITGGGGPAAVAFLRAFEPGAIEWFVVDIDPHAAGLYLTDEPRRALVPRGDDPAFVGALVDLCRRWNIDILIPTVDTELIPVATEREQFAALGVHVIVASFGALRNCLDKAALYEACLGVVPVPMTEILTHSRRTNVAVPAIAKPRNGSGSRDITLVHSEAELNNVPHDGTFLVQQYLCGAEYSVDVLARRDGSVASAVPRERLKVDSGIAVTARTVIDHELIALSVKVVEHLQLNGIVNVQWRRDERGTANLLEINPRIPGTLPITIASGVDMPGWLLAEAFGQAIPGLFEFTETAVVRHWSECIVPSAELVRMQVQSNAAASFATTSAA